MFWVTRTILAPMLGLPRRVSSPIGSERPIGQAPQRSRDMLHLSSCLASYRRQP